MRPKRLPDVAAPWKSIFPLTASRPQHVSRREFTKYLILVSGGLAAGSGWVAVRDRLFPHPPITGEHLVCKTQECRPAAPMRLRFRAATVPYILIHLE